MQSIKRHTNIGTSVPDPATTTPAHPLTTQDATVWLIGLGGTWIILTFLAEFDSTRELAVALSVVLVGSVLALHGQQAFTNLGVI